MTTQPPILVVDDDPEITSALSRGLAIHSYQAVAVHRCADAMQTLDTTTVGAAIVDVMIGSENGFDLVRTMREAGHRFPILMLSAMSEVEDRAAGLEAGADDYIVKPFSFDELVARLKVQEKRAASARPSPARLGTESRRLTMGSESAILTEREFDLLRLFLENADKVLSRGEIFDALWAGDGSSSENVVDVYLGYLRRKIGLPQKFGFQIKTLRGKGFVIDGLPPVFTPE